MFIGQRTQTINALRGHLAEHGVVAPKGAIHVQRLADAIEDEAIGLPEGVRVYLAQIEDLNVQATARDQRMKAAAKEAEAAQRAQTIPGVGPITALAIEIFAPDLKCFHSNGIAYFGKTYSRVYRRPIVSLMVKHCLEVLSTPQGGRKFDC